MNKYLNQAQKLVVKAQELTDEQKKAIQAIEKQIELAKSNMEMAFRVIDRDVEKKVITAGVARVNRVEVEVDTEAAIEKLHAQIREINPSFTANAKEVVANKSQELAYNAVQGAGKAAGILAQGIRPLWQIGKKAFLEARAAAAAEYKPVEKISKHDEIDKLEKLAQ